MRKYLKLSLEQIIEQVRVDKLSSDDFCLYGKEDGELTLNSLYWVSDYPDVVEDRDVYPTEVAEQNLQLVYYGEQLIDVLIVALEEKPESRSFLIEIEQAGYSFVRYEIDRRKL